MAEAFSLPLMLQETCIRYMTLTNTVAAEDFPAAGVEPDFVVDFRIATAVLHCLYLILLGAQGIFRDRLSQSRARFSETRLTKLAMITHILAGSTVVYIGVYLQFRNQIQQIKVGEESQTAFLVLYYLAGVAGVIHSITLLPIIGRVYGEKRITIPGYTTAGLLNLCNSIYLLYSPGLQVFFLLWGSMSTFVYVRVYIHLANLAYIDWELAYTYGLIAAAATAWPLTLQSPYVYLLFLLIAVYAPLHERVCQVTGWKVEDTLCGNMPAEKNTAHRKVMKTFAGNLLQDFKVKLGWRKKQEHIDHGPKMEDVVEIKNAPVDIVGRSESTMEEECRDSTEEI